MLQLYSVVFFGMRSVVVAGDLLDQLDDGTPEHGLLDPHERFGERKSVPRGEEFTDVTRRRRGAFSTGAPGGLGAPSKKNDTGTCRI